MSATFYWHDYETFGADPSRDRPVQFAGLRTDLELNIIGEPLVLFSRPAADLLPQPEACLLTGITPQQALARGVCEAEFIGRIHTELARPGTCGVGYNTLRFDDEVTRYTLYRNFHDPYEREYRNGNSRWDIIDMVRLTHALRPAGIVWPRREDGLPSFKLERLTAANGLGHESAHDARSDVEATIALARLIRDQQPRLFDYVRTRRHGQAVFAALDIRRMQPVLHVSGKFGAERNHMALVAPVALHPVNKNEVICVDLAADPACLADLSAEQIGDRLFCPRDQLPAGTARPPIKNIRANRCPIVLTPKFLDDATAERLDINVARNLRHHQTLQGIPGLPDKLRRVFARRQFPAPTDPDRMLYSGGFFGDADKRVMARIRAAEPGQLRDETFVFEDARLPEMLFRYRARNYPASLSPAERARWEAHRLHYLTDPAAGAGIALDTYRERVGQLKTAHPDRAGLLDALLDYGDRLLEPLAPADAPA